MSQKNGSTKPAKIDNAVDRRLEEIEANLELLVRYVRAIGRNMLGRAELAELEREAARRFPTDPSPPPAPEDSDLVE